jgi:molybdate-binding protein
LSRVRTTRLVLIKGYLQQQGIITRKRELISPFDDLNEVHFINQNAGSATRVTNTLLRLVGLARGTFAELTKSINCYDCEATAQRLA